MYVAVIMIHIPAIILINLRVLSFTHTIVDTYCFAYLFSFRIPEASLSWTLLIPIFFCHGYMTYAQALNREVKQLKNSENSEALRGNRVGHLEHKTFFFICTELLI